MTQDSRPAIEIFALIMDELRRVVTEKACEANVLGTVYKLLGGARFLLILARFQRIQAAFEVLAPKILAGTLRTRKSGMRTPKPRAAKERRADTPKAHPLSVLPREFGWLTVLVPGTIFYPTRRLLELLTEHPEMRALIASPRMARVLRPLLHMLQIEPDLLPGVPPRRVRAPRDSRAVRRPARARKDPAIRPHRPPPVHSQVAATVTTAAVQPRFAVPPDPTRRQDFSPPVLVSPPPEPPGPARWTRSSRGYGPTNFAGKAF